MQTGIYFRLISWWDHLRRLVFTGSVKVLVISPVKQRVYFVALALLGTSCAVTNNLYVNDPIPVARGEGNLYLGVGTGARAKIDSVDSSGNVSFANDLTLAPNLFFGGQVSLIDNLDLRFSVHLPYIIGGFGARLGPQYAFFSKDSRFNMAVGTDLGFVLAKDSLRIFGTNNALDVYASGAINADVFLTMGYQFNENSRIVITPRYSFNTLYIRQNTQQETTTKFKPQLPSVALGLYLNRIYIEASAFRFQDKYFPNVGLVYIFKPNDNRP